MDAARNQIFFIGNPLLDISVDISDSTMVEKYSLTPGLACLATPEQMPIYDECWNMESRTAIPGGSAMNSARAANYFMNHRGQTGTVTYFGAIGSDDKGEVLEKSISDAGITGNFHKETETPTGTCAVLVNTSNAERSLCANLAAACKYSPAHLQANMAQLD
jgi:sugar/nucleoside kinase (ribokinase family)